MGTDLFNSYYNNPLKQAVYTNLSCPGSKSDADIKFSFSDNEGVISDSKDVLSSIDLSNISSSISEWNMSSEVIPANSIIYLKGKTYGDSYKRIVYGKFIDDVLNYSSNEYTLKMNLLVCYTKANNCPCTDVISVEGYSIDDIVNNINDIFNDMKINVDVKVMSYDDSDNNNNLLSFESNKLGYDFYIDNVSYYVANEYLSKDNFNFDDYTEFPMEESLSLYIPAKKYRNGAFKGLIIVPKYPKFNNSISDDNKSLMITHLTDRVNMFYKNKDNTYNKYIFDVFGDLSIVQEYNNCIIFRDKHYYDDFDLSDLWLNDDQDSEFKFVNNGMKILSNKVLGVYGYCNYATINNLWQNFGDMYSIICAPDIDNSNAFNYVNSAIIYNPNNFDIKLNIIHWN